MVPSQDLSERDLSHLIARAKTNNAQLILRNKKSVIVLAISAIFVIFDGAMIYLLHEIAETGGATSSFPEYINDLVTAGNNILYFQIANTIFAIVLIYIMVRAYLESARIRMVRDRLEVAIREAESSAADYGY